MSPLLLSILLLLLGLGIIFLEIFLPSGGILGVVSLSSIIASIVLAYYNLGPTVGTVFLLATCVLLPLAISVALKWWPHTPIGRLLISRPPTVPEVLPDTEFTRGRHELVGKQGVAKSLMLPSGSVQIEGRSYDAVSQGMTIEPETPVEVLEFRANRLVVRPIEKSKLVSVQQNDLLSQPIETLISDPFSE